MNIDPIMQLRDLLPSSDSRWVAEIFQQMLSCDVKRALVFDGGTGELLGSLMVGGNRPGFLLAHRSPKFGDSGCPVYESAQLVVPQG